MELFKNILTIFQIVAYFLLGALFWFGISIYILCTLPIYTYRILVSRILVPCFFPNLGNLISVKGQGCATDFIKRHLSSSYRSSLVVSNIFTGTICPKNLHEIFLRRCINKKDEQGNIVFPEITQYIHPFMGFMYWKKDNNFKLENHIILHDIGNNSTDNISESFIRNLQENLMEKSFKRKQSPWEIHLVHNYRNSQICEKKMSVVIFLIHHSVADGPSIVNLLGEITFDREVDTLNTIIPKTNNSKMFGPNCVIRFIPSLLRFFYDSGYLAMLFLQRSKTPWLVPDSQKSSRFISARTNILPVNELKYIKNKFHVGFTTVILSCISAGISKYFNSDTVGIHEQLKTIPVIIPIPKWNSTKKLRFIGTGTIIDLPLLRNATPIERLNSCQEQLNYAKRSTIPILINIFCQLFLTNVSTLSRFLGRNRVMPTGISVFPIPNNEGVFNGINKLLAVDIFSGGQLGNTGVVFHVPSFRNELSVCITAEGSLFNREKLNELSAAIENEFELLREINSDNVQNV